ncbi:MAG: hypothetical protein KAS86_00990, partial [Candidatus Omnitrophica bacterium]|nr:hypothetical protein [Candidatus Omnitrophota bacterium]
AKSVSEHEKGIGTFTAYDLHTGKGDTNIAEKSLARITDGIKAMKPGIAEEQGVSEDEKEFDALAEEFYGFCYRSGLTDFYRELFPGRGMSIRGTAWSIRAAGAEAEIVRTGYDGSFDLKFRISGRDSEQEAGSIFLEAVSMQADMLGHRITVPYDIFDAAGEDVGQDWDSNDVQVQAVDTNGVMYFDSEKERRNIRASAGMSIELPPVRQMGFVDMEGGDKVIFDPSGVKRVVIKIKRDIASDSSGTIKFGPVMAQERPSSLPLGRVSGKLLSGVVKTAMGKEVKVVKKPVVPESIRAVGTIPDVKRKMRKLLKEKSSLNAQLSRIHLETRRMGKGYVTRRSGELTRNIEAVDSQYKYLETELESMEQARQEKHPFAAIAGMKASLLTQGLSLLSFFAGAAEYFVQGDFTGQILAAALVGLYLGWASIRFLLVSSTVFETLKRYYGQHPDLEKFPGTNGIPTSLQILTLEIAESDGYRHPAFYSLPAWVRDVISTHESYTSHIWGMFAMLPFGGIFVEKSRPHALAKAEIDASSRNIYSMYEIDFARRHAERVEKIAALLAEKMGLSGEVIHKIRFAAAVHDLAAYREPIDKKMYEAARKSLAKKGITLTEGPSSDVDRYNELIRIFSARRDEFSLMEMACAVDLFQGPASLRVAGKNRILLSRSQKTAVLFHHNISELEAYLSRQFWPESEKDEARLIASVLVAADTIENGMNLFKQIFFRGNFEVETSEHTRRFLRTRSGIPVAYLPRILRAFDDLRDLEKYRSIGRDAAKVSGAERKYLHGIGRGIGPATWFEDTLRRIRRILKGDKGSVVVRRDKLVTLLDKEFPEEPIDKIEFVNQFRDGLPPRVLKNKEDAAFLVTAAYQHAIDVLENTERLSFEIYDKPDLPWDRLIVAFADVRRGISKFILDTIVDAGVNVEREGTFFVEVPYGDSTLRICIDIKDITAEGVELDAETKRKIRRDLREFPVTPIREYYGVSSIRDAMVEGTAAYYDAGEGIDIAAILHNIIVPVEAQYDAELAAELVEKEIEDFLITIRDIQREVGLGQDVLKELLSLVKEVEAELRSGIVRGRRIMKPKAVVLLHRKIADRISGLKGDMERLERENAPPVKILPLALNTAIFEKLDQAIIEDVLYGRIERKDVSIHRDRLEAVIRKVMGEELIARLASLRPGDMTDLDHMTNAAIEAVTRHVSRRIEEDLLPLPMALYEESAGLDRRLAKLEGAKGEEVVKRREEIKEQQNIIRKVASGLKGVVIEEFRAEETAEKHILFLKGMLLPSEIKKLVEEKKIAAIVTTEAGPTTHWVLAAKGLNVPVFFATHKPAGRMFELRMDGLLSDVRMPEDQVLLDGSRGSLIIGPDRQTIEVFDDKVKRLSVLGRYYDEIKKEPLEEPGTAMDSRIYANIEEKDSMLAALSNGADGAGLIRTELWLEKDLQCVKTLLSDIATQAEREEAKAELKEYLKAHIQDLIEHSEGRPLTFRTFDVAEDKREIAGYVAGSYGIDLYRTLEGACLLAAELEAIYESVLSTGADNVRIIFPAVNTAGDMKEVREWAWEAIERITPSTRDRARLSLIPVGAMIESRIAVENTLEISKISDFISIGTNDLTRDIYRHLEKEWGVSNLRMNIRGIQLFTRIQPEILKELEKIARAVSRMQEATGRRIPVTVCGEAAGIKGYQLHMRYMADKYDIDLYPSVPFIEVAESKMFMSYLDSKTLEAVFREIDRDVIGRVQEEVNSVEDRIANLDRVKLMMLEELERVPEAREEKVVTEALAAPEDLKALSEAGRRHTKRMISLNATGPLGVHARPAGRIAAELGRINEEIGPEDALTVTVEPGSTITNFMGKEFPVKEQVRIVPAVCQTQIMELHVGGTGRGSRLEVGIEGPAEAVHAFIRYLAIMTEESATGPVDLFEIK